MSPPTSWNWNNSNGNASAVQTQTAHYALTHNGSTRNFSVIVWNDIVDKIIEQRQAWGDTEWSIAAPATKGQTWMIPGEQMTAKIFNSAVVNMPPIHPWGWEATLGRKSIRKGDTCYGAYFIYLVDGLNHWIIDLSPRYIKPPNPFIMGVSMHDKTLVRRALHIINNQNIVWRNTSKARLDRSLHLKSRPVFHLSINLDLPLFTVQHVMLPLFYNLRLRNNTAVTTAEHIICNNPIQLDLNSRISFDTMAYIRCAVNGQSALIGTLSIPASAPILIDNTIELSDSGKVIVSTPEGFAGAMTDQFIIEAYVREPDSILVKENLEIEYNSSAKFTFSDILNLIAELNIGLTPTVDVTVSAVGDLIAALNMELDHTAAIKDGTATQIAGQLIANHSMNVMAYRRRFSTHRADLEAELITSAAVGFAPVELYTSADLLMQSEMAAVFDFANHYLSTGTDLTMQFLMAAAAELQNNKLPMSSSTTDTFDMEIEAAVNPNPMGMSAALSDTTVGPDAEITVVPGSSVAPTSVEMEHTVSIAATVSTSDNRLYAAGSIDSTHTCSAAVQLIDAIEFSGNATSEHTGSVEFSMRGTVPVIADMVFSLTDSATITTQSFVLASEIDDELVSDLDDTLVHDVEFRYNT